MITALKTFFGGGASLGTYVMAGLVVALVLTGGFAYWQMDRVSDRDQTIGQLRADVDEATRAAEQNLAAYKAARIEHDRVVGVLSDRLKDVAASVERMTVIRKDIENAPAADDGPVAPVLARTLDGLRRRGGTESGDRDPAREAGRAGRPADLRGGTGRAGR